MKMKCGICAAILGLVTCALSTFSAQPARSEESISWSAPTNGARVGISTAGADFTARQAKIMTWITNSSAGYLVFLIPKSGSGFELSVLDSNGAPVQKTTAGLSLGQRIPAVRRINEREHGQLINRRVVLAPGQFAWIYKEQINLFEYFNISKPGTYRVVYEQRLERPVDRYTLEGLVWPKIATEIEIK